MRRESVAVPADRSCRYSFNARWRRPGPCLSTIKICLFFSFLILGTPTTAQIPDPSPAITPPPPYSDLVHPGDVIDVDVLGGFEFDWRGTLTPEGFLDGLDGFSEPVRGLCRSETDIAADVARVYGRLLRDPKIVVRIVDRSNRAVARIDGAVRMPTRFRIQRRVHLRELIVLAGGLTDRASGEIRLLRPRNMSCQPSDDARPPGDTIPAPDNGTQTRNIKISELLGGTPDANPQVLSGDIITVTRAEPVYIIGAVNNPRPIYSPTELTVSRAIASAGGLARSADARKISILRRDGAGRNYIEVDLVKIKRGDAPDEVLKQFDILDVAAKGGGRREYPPVGPADDTRDHGNGDLPLKVVD